MSGPITQIHNFDDVKRHAASAAPTIYRSAAVGALIFGFSKIWESLPVRGIDEFIGDANNMVFSVNPENSKTSDLTYYLNEASSLFEKFRATAGQIASHTGLINNLHHNISLGLSGSFLGAVAGGALYVVNNLRKQSLPQTAQQNSSFVPSFANVVEWSGNTSATLGQMAVLGGAVGLCAAFNPTIHETVPQVIETAKTVAGDGVLFCIAGFPYIKEIRVATARAVNSTIMLPFVGSALGAAASFLTKGTVQHGLFEGLANGFQGLTLFPAFTAAFFLSNIRSNRPAQSLAP